MNCVSSTSSSSQGDQISPAPAKVHSRPHKTWFSPTGLRRGLILAGFAGVAWSGWALGYVQGMAAPAPIEVQGSGPVLYLDRAPVLDGHHHNHHAQTKSAGV